MKKEKLALLAFWLVLLAFVVNWSCVGKIVHRISHQRPKPMLTQQERQTYTEKINSIIKAVEEKGKSLTSEEYFRSLFALSTIQQELKNYFGIPQTLKNLTLSLSPYYDQLVRKIARQGMIPGIVLDQASAKVWQEVMPNGLIGEMITADAIKKFFLWLLKVWFVGLLLIPFLYTYRCWLMKKSLKELVLLQTLNFFGHVVFWFIGLMVEYPKNTIDVAHKYYQIKSNYMHETGRRHLTEEEEMMLWQRARGRIETFDQSVAKAVQYSKLLAFVTSLFILIFVPKKGLFAAEKKEVAPITKTVSGFAQLRYKQEIGFFVPLTVFTLKGNLNQNLGYNVEVNPAAYFTNRNEMLRDVWVQYTSKPWLKFRLGRQFMFFTMLPPPNELWLVEYPKMNNELATIYDTGIVAELDTKFLSCYAGVVNGSGEKFSDDNTAKDFYIHPVIKSENLSAGFVYQAGEHLQGQRKKYGGHAEAEFSSVHVLVEYTAEKIGEQKKDGWYMIAVYTVSNFQLIAQYDEFSAEAKEHTTIIGVNYNPNNKFKLKLNYTSQKKLLACAQFSF